MMRLRISMLNLLGGTNDEFKKEKEACANKARARKRDGQWESAFYNKGYADALKLVTTRLDTLYDTFKIL